MADIDSAERKINKVIMTWFLKDPVIYNVASMLERKPKTDQHTMGLDVRTRNPVLNYNPNFVNSVSEEYLELVLVTEFFKVLLRHCTTRLKEPRQISSLASSITINQLMNSDLAKILGGLNDFTPDPIKFGLPNNLVYEEYYTGLMNKVNDVNKKIKEIWDSMSEEEKKELIESAQNVKKSDTDEDGYHCFSNDNEAMKEYFNPNGTANDGWGKNDIFDAKMQSYIENKKSSKSGWGDFTGKAMSEIVAANEPKISYKEILRRFNASITTCNKISTRMKVNRRFGLSLPGYRRTYTSKLIFAVDVSASMSDRELAEGFAVVNSTCKHADITYVLFDTEITSVEKKVKKARETFQVTGRGGTDFQEIVDYAEKENVDGLVIYTDGIASAPKEPKNTKILWLLHNKDHTPPVDWGYRAYLSIYEDVN